MGCNQQVAAGGVNVVGVVEEAMDDEVCSPEEQHHLALFLFHLLYFHFCCRLAVVLYLHGFCLRIIGRSFEAR